MLVDYLPTRDYSSSQIALEFPTQLKRVIHINTVYTAENKPFRILLLIGSRNNQEKHSSDNTIIYSFEKKIFD